MTRNPMEIYNPVYNPMAQIKWAKIATNTCGTCLIW